MSSDQLHHLLGRWGYPFVLLMTALQSAGVPVPGTTALIVAALYAGTTGRLDIVWVVLAALAGAVIGNLVGYGVGRRGGWGALERYGHLVRLTPSRLQVGRYVFREHGAKVVFFGRFISGLRTWAAFLAGSARMPALSFVVFSSAAAAIWAVANGLGYYFFGDVLTNASTPINIALLALFLAWATATALYLRRQKDAIRTAAERAYADDEGD